MNIKPLLFLLSILLTLSAFKQREQVDEWVYEREKKGIKIFTKKSKWGKLRDSKATMTIASSPEEVLKLITDFDNYSTWIPRCKKARVVARLNENEFIGHMTFNAPWPVADRDCVVRVRIDRDSRTGAILVTETSEPKYITSSDDVVRIQQLTVSWHLVPKNGGTEITNISSSNPGGNLPDWLTNSQSVENPLATFENLANQTTTKK